MEDLNEDQRVMEYYTRTGFLVFGGYSPLPVGHIMSPDPSDVDLIHAHRWRVIGMASIQDKRRQEKELGAEWVGCSHFVRCEAMD